MKKIFTTILATAAMACAFAASAFAMDVVQANAAVNLRTGPGTSYSVLAVVPAGGSVYINENDNGSGWTHISYGDMMGWVASKYLGNHNQALDAQPTSSGSTVTVNNRYVTTAGVNMRQGPSTDYDVITVVPGNAAIFVQSYANGWAYASYGSAAGYVSTKYISGLGAGTAANTSNNDAGSGIVISAGEGTSSNGGSGSTWYGGKNYANVYNYDYYCAHNQDIVSVLGTDPNAVLDHFVNYGMSEGRQAISSFNVYTYRDQHPDLANLWGDNLPNYYLYACGLL